MDWWVVAVVPALALVILFPAAYVWGMNISGAVAAMKRARQKRIAARNADPLRGFHGHGYLRLRPVARRVAYATLALLLAVLFPLLIWVALFAAVRQPVLRAARRVGYALLFLFAGISMPLLIWVAFVAAARRPALRAARKIAYAASFFLFGVFMPLLIWVALAVAIREPLVRGASRLAAHRWQFSGLKGAAGRAAFAPLLLIFAVLMPALIWLAGAIAVREMVFRWRESRLPSALICRYDNDCPPGYVCVGGRCVPQY